jgi:hypothetical protein
MSRIGIPGFFYCFASYADELEMLYISMFRGV